MRPKYNELPGGISVWKWLSGQGGGGTTHFRVNDAPRSRHAPIPSLSFQMLSPFMTAILLRWETVDECFEAPSELNTPGAAGLCKSEEGHGVQVFLRKAAL